MPGDTEKSWDEIAELSAHLEAATARLLDLIREFDAHGGWNTGLAQKFKVQVYQALEK